MSFHIGAKKNEIAKIVLLPGDPLRAKFIAESFLSDINEYSSVRNMLGFTGVYKGVKISVQGGGMGIPSTSIYTNELIKEYDVKTIIRVGTTGSIKSDIHIGETILAQSACTDSNVNRLAFGGMDYSPIADFGLLMKAYQTAQDLSIPVTVGAVFSTDSFYNGSPDRYHIWAQHGVLALEMESTALYTLAAKNNAKALTILTVSDNIITGEAMSAEEREHKIEHVARLALETAI
jgi:purine-nucleoside phosphorylase